MARKGSAPARDVKAPGSRVYDLRKFAPEPIGFIADDGVTYWISADPSVNLVAEMLVLDNVLNARVDEIDDLDVESMTEAEIESELGLRLARAAIRAKEIIVELAREQDPAVVDIPLKGGQLLQLLGLVTGGNSTAEAVARDLSLGMASLSEQEQAELAAQVLAARETGEEDEEGPLASRSSSSRRSRSSTATRTTGRTAGRPAGG